MKKSILVIYSLSLLALVFTSCKKDEDSNEPFTNGSATINGVAFIDNDVTNNVSSRDSREFVANGVRLYATYNTKDLVQFPSDYTNYSNVTISTTVQANGEFSFTIPANDKPVSVSITSDDFKTDYITSDTTYQKIYFIDTITETVHNGVVKLLKVEAEAK